MKICKYRAKFIHEKNDFQLNFLIFMATKTFLKFKPQTDLASDRYHKLFLSGIVVSPIPACQWKTFSTFAIQVGYTNSKFGISFNLYPEM